MIARGEEKYQIEKLMFKSPQATEKDGQTVADRVRHWHSARYKLQRTDASSSLVLTQIV